MSSVFYTDFIVCSYVVLSLHCPRLGEGRASAIMILNAAILCIYLYQDRSFSFSGRRLLLC